MKNLRDFWCDNYDKKFHYWLGHHFPRVRPSTEHVKKNYKGDLMVVELGVRDGDNAKSLLNTLNIKTLYLVDIWDIYEDSNGTSYDYRDVYENVKKRFRKYGNKVQVLKGTLVEVRDSLPDNIDFMYIDANHQEEYIREDIKNGYPVVRKGGIIGGHDFGGNHIGVIKAVLDFSKKHDVELRTRHPDWWMVKNEK